MHTTHSLRVRYAETDQMGVVYHANYLVWFEMGRVELLRSLGFTYREMESDAGCILPVADIHCRYRLPARYDDLLVVETRPLLVRSALVKFAYRLLRSEDSGATTVLAEAESTHIVCDNDLNRCKLPERYLHALQNLLAQ